MSYHRILWVRAVHVIECDVPQCAMWFVTIALRAAAGWQGGITHYWSDN